MPTHGTRHWQDWASYGLALWLAVSPWLADYAAHDAATANAAVCGLALAVIAHFGGTCEHMSCEWLDLGGGLWEVRKSETGCFHRLTVEYLERCHP